MKYLQLFILLFFIQVTTAQLLSTPTCGPVTYEKQPVKACRFSNHFEISPRGRQIHLSEFEFHDQYGNTYCTETENLRRPNKTIKSSYFTLTFESNIDGQPFPSEYIEVARQVVADMEVLIFKEDNPGNQYLRKIQFEYGGIDGDALATGLEYYRLYRSWLQDPSQRGNTITDNGFLAKSEWRL
ncbi:hypothetical protein GCM10009117_10360 [Gangjinia marincola]|uniref:Uncharacterized protein n=1 Tax=Gangjinia marincola TaxID=578463 RepID=A0ABP3XU56_9FLAO